MEGSATSNWRFRISSGRGIETASEILWTSLLEIKMDQSTSDVVLACLASPQALQGVQGVTLSGYVAKTSFSLKLSLLTISLS